MLTIYEAILLFRVLPKDELAASLKRTTGFIFDKGGFLRQFHYLGLQKCPWRQTKDRTPFWEANYFFWEFNMPKVQVPELGGQLSRDFDVIRFNISNNEMEMAHPIDFENCTFEEEMLPVPYRPPVIKLVEKAREFAAKKDKSMKFNTGLDYFPFQR